MSAIALSELQREALQEIANIGMGQAGASIAGVLDEFVQLSIPRLWLGAASAIPAAIGELVGDAQCTAIRQGFHGQLRGEAVVIFGLGDSADLGDLLGYGPELDAAGERELLLDLSNILVGACLGGIGEQLGTELGFSAPSFLADRVPAPALLNGEELGHSSALLLEVNFRLEERSFSCHLIVLMPEDEVLALAGALDRFLASLQ